MMDWGTALWAAEGHGRLTNVLHSPTSFERILLHRAVLTALPEQRASLRGIPTQETSGMTRQQRLSLKGLQSAVRPWRSV